MVLAFIELFVISNLIRTSIDPSTLIVVLLQVSLSLRLLVFHSRDFGDEL